MAKKTGIKKPQICQAGSAVTFEDSYTTGAEQTLISFITSQKSSKICRNYLINNDHPSYSDCSERAPWALVTGVEPLNGFPAMHLREFIPNDMKSHFNAGRLLFHINL